MTSTTPPDHKRALHALDAVQALSGPELDKLMTTAIGPHMLGIFSALARAQEPAIDDDTRARRVHLMVLAYLLRREVEST